MPARCIFYCPGQLQVCEVLRAKGGRSLSIEIQDTVEYRHCSTDAFTSCPIFQKLEQGLSDLNLRLDYASPASVEVSGK